jgi:hypothetical protein
MRRKMQLRFSGLVMALVLALAGLVVAPGTAAATDNVPGSPGSSCAGSQVKGSPFTRSTYYSRANGGTNCIIARKSGAWAGRKTFMNLSIWLDDSRALGEYPAVAYDYGAYRYYAGAVSIPRTNGRCISASLDLGSGASGGTQFNYWLKEAFACG